MSASGDGDRTTRLAAGLRQMGVLLTAQELKVADEWLQFLEGGV